jgi:hypothetical protein
VLRPIPVLVAAAWFVVALVAAMPAAAGSIPSGERVLGQAVIEPVYNDETGAIGFVSTPLNAPTKANPRAWAPFYAPVYPVGSTVGPLLCQHTPVENCPTHGDAIAGLAQALAPVPSVYAAGVLGHDHLMDFPGGEDFNIAWEPILVLFTSSGAANEHLILDSQVETAVAKGDAVEIPLPPATFLCAAVPASVYAQGMPLH